MAGAPQQYGAVELSMCLVGLSPAASPLSSLWPIKCQ